MQLTPETIVFGLGIFLALWYLGAAIVNRRRGLAVFFWLRNGFDQLGGEVSSRWIGSSGSGAQIQIRKAAPPFKEIQLIYLLASRELLPLFLFDLLRGKRDRLFFKATLRVATPGEVEVVRAGSGLARQMRAEKAHPWTLQDGPHGLLIGARGRGAAALCAAQAPFLEKYGPLVQHISWSRQAPQFIVILSLAGLYTRGGSAAGLFTDLAAAASAAGEKDVVGGRA